MKRHWLAALGGFGLVAGSTWAAPPATVPCTPPIHYPCPPGQVVPGTPGVPLPPGLPGTASGMPNAPGTPPAANAGPGQTPPAAPGAAPTPAAPAGAAAPSDPGTAPAPERGGEAYATNLPGMFGDAVSGAPRQLVIRVPKTVSITRQFLQPNGTPLGFTQQGAGAATIFLTPPGTTVFGTTITENFVASGAPIAGGTVFPLRENSQDRAATLAGAPGTAPEAKDLSPGGTIKYNSDPSKSFAKTATPGTANVTTTYDYTGLTNASVPLALPSPSYGGAVGRTKISDDNSPLPRDRIIFSYDGFSNVPLTQNGGVNVNRFSPGFETTFLDGNTSVEVRVPFATTLSNQIDVNGATDTGSGQLGNVNVTLKALLYSDDALNVAGGLAIAAPTASDLHVIDKGTGNELLRLKNQAVVLTPYLAYLWTPSENVFFQKWAGVALNTDGNPVFSNPNFTGLERKGKLYDQHLLQLDAQLGYWLINPGTSTGFLRGLAPFAEVHYNMALGKAHILQVDQFSLGPVNKEFNELNVSCGAIFLLSNAVNVTVGAAFPTLGQRDRTFDYQLGVRLNVFYGQTLRSLTPAAAVSSF